MASSAVDATTDGQVNGLRVVGALAATTAVAGAVLELGTLCPLRRATGIPCPLCGLTTGVAAAVQGDLPAAVHAHPAALVALAVLVLAWTPLAPSMVEILRRHNLVIAVGLAVLWMARLSGAYGS
jgi:hypothetical protein